jgi:uncharacterized membrane protein YhaH (DUF805 family)
MRKFIKSLWGFSGRLGRRAFLLRFLAIFVLFRLLLLGVLNFIAHSFINVAHIVFVILFSSFLVLLTGLVIRRLHDFNFSGLWLFPLLMLLFLSALFSIHSVELFLYNLLFYLIILVAVPGAKGANKFTTDPLVAKNQSSNGDQHL